MKSPTFATSAGSSARRSTSRTMALPTMAPSACWTTAATWAGVEIPKPTPIGLVVTLRRSRTSRTSSGGTSVRSPVIPVSGTR